MRADPLGAVGLWVVPRSSGRAPKFGLVSARSYNDRVTQLFNPERAAPTYGRRTFLRLLAASGGALLVACSGVSGRPAPGEVNLGGPAPPQLPVTPEASTAPALQIAVQPPVIGAGEAATVEVRAHGAASVVVDFLGVRSPLWPAGDRLMGMIGVPLEQPPTTAVVLAAIGLDASGAEVARAETTCAIISVDRPVDYLLLTPDQASVLTLDASVQEAAIRAAQFVRFDRARRWQRALGIPVEGPITTLFGSGRSYNAGPVGSFHTGTDIGAPEGASVLAAAPGRVDWVGEMPIRGISVLVDHGDGVKTGYHLTWWRPATGLAMWERRAWPRGRTCTGNSPCGGSMLIPCRGLSAPPRSDRASPLRC